MDFQVAVARFQHIYHTLQKSWSEQDHQDDVEVSRAPEAIELEEQADRQKRREHGKSCRVNFLELKKYVAHALCATLCVTHPQHSDRQESAPRGASNGYLLG